MLFAAPPSSIGALRRRHGFVVAALVIIVVGCATLTPQEQDTVADVQHFADGTATAYNLPQIRVTIEPATNLGIGGRYRQGNFYLNARTLGSGTPTALVAHELAHYVLGHEPMSGPSMAELQRAQELRELDANAKAVEILMRVRGMSETEAVRTMVTHLRRAQGVIACGGALAPGHRLPADEIANLIARFPDSAPLLAGIEESIPLDSRDPRDSAGALAAEKPTSRSAVAAIPVPVPVWKPGDTWTFCLQSPTGNGMYVWSVDREEMVEGVSHYVIKQGTREIFYRTADLAHTRETVNGAVVRQHSPSRIRYVWPLEVGKIWEQAFREDRPVDRRTTEREDTVSVEGEETVGVPAGTFRTLKIAYRNTRTTAIRYEEWYAPELKNPVRIRERLDSGLQVRELVAYRLQ
ncbi:MAG: hypothetical protein DMD98_08140 [Candidatus Rokuibacteriota bacterium]|nr:MAG: hypothetical protein DMD98_08140 [Candidatus Rokubacteria bacterium]